MGTRRYWQCPQCQLIALDPSHYLSAAAERAEYSKHNNDPAQPGYRRFLQPALSALQQNLPAPAQVLDYGCGPGPALGQMLSEAGYEVQLYDPLFAKDESLLQRRYAGITCTEVAEHWHQPALELAILWRMLLPGGVLVLQTQPLRSREAFVHWRYRNDPTHVHFFAHSSFEQWARDHQAGLHFATPAIAILRKPDHEFVEK